MRTWRPLSLYDAPDKNRIYEAEGRIGRFAQMYPAGVTEILARGLTRRSLCEGGNALCAQWIGRNLAARPGIAPACARTKRAMSILAIRGQALRP